MDVVDVVDAVDVVVVVVWLELEVKICLEEGEVLVFTVDVRVLQEERELFFEPKDLTVLVVVTVLVSMKN